MIEQLNHCTGCAVVVTTDSGRSCCCEADLMEAECVVIVGYLIDVVRCCVDMYALLL